MRGDKDPVKRACQKQPPFETRLSKEPRFNLQHGVFGCVFSGKSSGGRLSRRDSRFILAAEDEIGAAEDQDLIVFTPGDDRRSAL